MRLIAGMRHCCSPRMQFWKLGFSQVCLRSTWRWTTHCPQHPMNWMRGVVLINWGLICQRRPLELSSTRVSNYLIWSKVVSSWRMLLEVCVSLWLQSDALVVRLGRHSQESLHNCPSTSRSLGRLALLAFVKDGGSHEANEGNMAQSRSRSGNPRRE